MKEILNFLLRTFRVLCTLIVILYFFIVVLYFSLEKINEMKFPSLRGYTYHKINDNYLEPEIKQNNILIFKENSEFKINDIILYIENNNRKVGKIIDITDEKITIDYINISNPKVIYVDTNAILNSNPNSLEEINYLYKEDIFGTMIYNNNIFSKVVNILTHWITLIIMIIFIVIIPNKTYKRFKFVQ